MNQSPLVLALRHTLCLLFLAIQPALPNLCRGSDSKVDDQRWGQTAPSYNGMRLFCFSARMTKPFAVTLYVKSVDVGQTATLHLPDGLSFADNQPVALRVPPPNEHGYAVLIWKVKAVRAGEFKVKVDIRGIGRAEADVRVPESGIP